jgi:hypothetical protein
MEVEIDLIDLLWKILMQWKAVLLVCIAMALIVPGIKYTKDKNDYQAALAAQKEAEAAASRPAEDRIEEALAPLSSDDRAGVVFLMNQRELLDQQRDYLANSILLRNPSSQRQLVTNYLIRGSESSDMRTLADTYTTHLHSKDAVSVLRDAIDPEVSVDYISELIITSSDNETVVDGSATSMVYSVAIVLPEQADADAVSNAVSSIMSDASSAVSSVVGEHSLRSLDTTDTHEFSKDLAETKLELTTKAATLATNLNNAENALNDQQKVAYEAIKLIETSAELRDDGAEAMSDEAIAPPGFSKKFALIGFLLGAVLYVAVYAIYLICKKCVASASSAQNYTGTRVLADLYRQLEHNGLSGLFTSKGIAKYRYKKKLDIDAQIGLLTNTVMALCEHNNIDRMTILRSGVPAGFDEAINILITKLKSDGNVKLEVLDADNIDEKAMSDISNAMYAVSGETKLSSLDRLHALIHDYDVATFGTVYMEEL